MEKVKIENDREKIRLSKMQTCSNFKAEKIRDLKK
jgi:hypothetical protein